MKINRMTNLGAATLESYIETRRELLRKADELTVRISQMEPVRTLEEMDALLAVDRDRRLVMEMVASCSYVIEWLETGRRPGSRRGIERRAGYQREVPTDPERMPSVSIWERAEPESRNDEAGRFRLEVALRGLTERERSCYTLAHGESFSYSEIAAMLNISKSSVGTYIVRAQRKVDGNVGSIHILVG
ncbi:sigma factor-like helix-turn-helix DNA-binding protein [Cohnella hongkongensis]|uniref:Sigma factor-like helix-turn-helix DNA-binding protein n=1 Tax=Cohnella hongkongensis TaxID=178337 RepID=A0ABV9FFG0_9BACL